MAETKKVNQTPPPVLETDDPLVQGMYSDDEKKEILSAIDQAASSNRLTADTQALKEFKPRKKGFLLPVLVNLAALLLLTAGWFVLDVWSKSRQESLKLSTDKIFSTEGKLLAKFLEESKAQLDAKNKEIERIQSEMTKLQQEQAQMQQQFNDKLSMKEIELRAELAKELEAERKRLEALGLTEEEVNRRLKTFAAQKEAQFNLELAAFKRQAQAELDKRNEELNVLQGRLQATVAEQERLRADIEKQTKAREADLQNQLNQQSANLERLGQERDELNLFFRQADAQFASVRDAFDALDAKKAEAALTGLDQILTKASESKLEAVRQRAAAEKEVVATLRKGIAGLTLEKGDPRFETFKAQIKKAQENPNTEDKRQTVAKAVAALPEVETAYQILAAWDRQRELDQIQSKINQLEKTLADADPDQAFVQYAALSPSPALGESLNRVYSQKKVLAQDVRSQLELRENELSSLKETHRQLLNDFTGSAKTIRDLKEELKTFTAKVADLQKNIDELTVYKTQVLSLTELYAKNKDLALKALYNTEKKDFAAAKKAFLVPFESEAGTAIFPEFAAALDSLLGTDGPVTVVKEMNPKPIRDKAFDDVLAFTGYLGGTSIQAKADQTKAEKLSREDDKYKQVIDSIQTLAKNGSRETLIKTEKFSLLGALVSVNGTRAAAELLTKVQPDVGQAVEIRRASGKTEQVIAQGRVTAASGRRVDLEIGAGAASSPASGDSVYLILK